MPFTLTMPKLSPTMEEGTIATWHKKEGEKVEAGDVLFEVSTDKATVEYNALDEGWLKKIIVKEGQSAAVNQPVAILTEEENEDVAGYEVDTTVGGAPSQQPSPSASTQTQSEENVRSDQAFDETSDRPSAQSISMEEKRVMASPLAKKLAKEQGVDLGQIKGSGPRNRIMSKDLEQQNVRQKLLVSAAAAGSFKTENLTPIRKIIAQRLQEAKSTIPHFYVQSSIDAQPLLELREHLKELDVVVSINDCIVKACAIALKHHPVINSGFNAKDNTLIRFQTVDISIAVSVDGGLITPIVQNADTKHLSDISKEIRGLAKRAKEGKLSPNEYQGGSFTISNLGMFGVTNFQAIINPPQAAILAVSGILDTPVVKDNKVIPGKIMNINLSADHRVIDGVAAAEFLNTLKKLLEKPISLVL